MKLLRIFIVFAVFIAIVTSCGNPYPRVTFDKPFPKHNLRLTHIFGNELMIKSGKDTMRLKIFSTRKFNVITDAKTGDTLFRGKVCKYRGLYYFNQQLNDTAWEIYAVQLNVQGQWFHYPDTAHGIHSVKLNWNLIYGLNTSWIQEMLIGHFIEKGEYSKMVKYKTPQNIILHPEKRQMKRLFAIVMDSLIPDTIITPRKDIPLVADTAKTIPKMDTEANALISNVYPNPTKGIVTIKLQQKGNVTYYLVNMQGKTVLTGQFTGDMDKIDLSDQPEGVYALDLVDWANSVWESVKVVKAR